MSSANDGTKKDQDVVDQDVLDILEKETKEFDKVSHATSSSRCIY